ncbi:hypothetical protein [Flavobacterium sp.]|jgi:hypothetical protein|uniref:hypothetical protein n=1 Tax=Flavobacterium sp. TaxID=239 RepID=UPI0026073623|nr:hypothetical protein [Flavobacterium sp.]
MDTPSIKEDHDRQIPALQMLVNWGCTDVINQNQHDKVIGFMVQKQMIISL